MRNLGVGIGTVLASLAMAAPAGAASLDSVVMYSDENDYVGQGEPRMYHPGNAEITVERWHADEVTVIVEGDSSTPFRMVFAAPEGEALAPGVYDGAHRAAYREPGRPGMRIGGDGRACGSLTGRFEVRTLDVAPDGRVERLWIVYEQHCDGGPAALFGEVRLGIPGPAGPLAHAPSIVRWPPAEPGFSGRTVPVTFVADGPVAIESATIAGDEFTLREDGCGGRTLGAGGSCDVHVQYTPRSAGTKGAVLRVRAGGAVHDVRLQGFSYGGRSRLVLDSEPGDYIGAGKQWSYASTAGDIVWSEGGPERMWFGVEAANGDWWNGRFEAAEGDVLTPGSTYHAPEDGGPEIDVGGEGRGCGWEHGTFTVHELTFIDDDGLVRTFAADFVQYCEDMEAPLRGTIEFRAGDTTPPPPWMVTGPPMDIGGAPDEPAATSTSATREPTTSGATAVATTGACAATRWAALPLVQGGGRADRLRGGSFAERLIAGDGDDRIAARGGRDCVDGGRGDDRIHGGAGADLLLGGPGADVLVGGPGRDRLVCGRGRDVARNVTRGDRTSGCERVVRARR